jgi:hypothetical protein
MNAREANSLFEEKKMLVEGKFGRFDDISQKRRPE